MLSRRIRGYRGQLHQPLSATPATSAPEFQTCQHTARFSTLLLITIPMSSPPKVEYVLFDNDGLLIDSEKIYTEVTNEILAEYGVEMTWDIKAGLMGMPERESAIKLLSYFPGISLTLSDYLERRNIGQNARWPTVPLLPGAARLIEHLAKHNIPIAVATGSRRAAYTLKTGHLSNTYELFATRVLCGDDNIEGEEGHGSTRRVKGKPDPDIFLAAARTLLGRKVGWGDADGPGVSDEERLERAKGLVFEDAIPGMQAGKRAGMSVVWVPDSNLLDVEYFGAHKADQTIRSLLDFKPEEWGLPPFDNNS